jgi:hypothetical protein
MCKDELTLHLSYECKFTILRSNKPAREKEGRGPQRQRPSRKWHIIGRYGAVLLFFA